jgi:hypothetical protein
VSWATTAIAEKANREIAKIREENILNFGIGIKNYLLFFRK